MAAGLPIRLHDEGSGTASEECVRLADNPPTRGADTIHRLERCSALIPYDVELLADLGRAYEAESRAGDAERAYQQALELDPQYADVRVRLATLFLRRNATAAAREQAEIALQIQPNRAAIRRLLDEIERGQTQ